MISEKTVELNLSMELINHINYRNNLSVFAIAPSQRQESTLGYDVEIGQGTASGILIQYKRAIPNANGTEYHYHLNYTSNQDQHRILLNAEQAGHSVLYAFPLFHEVHQISANRRRLLRQTAWYKPSQINLPGGPVGKHTLHINVNSKKYYVTSEPTEVGPPLSFKEVNYIFDSLKSKESKNVATLTEFLNSQIVDRSNEFERTSEYEENWQELSQQFIIMVE